MTEESCVFCKIVAGEIPATVVWDSPWAVAFLDINPAAPGHVLLVLKQHYSQLADVPGSLLAAALTELPRLAAAVVEATGAAGLNVLQNNGRVAGQVIPHVHFHLIPRNEGDQVTMSWQQGSYENAEQMEQVAERIRQRLAR